MLHHKICDYNKVNNNNINGYKNMLQQKKIRGIGSVWLRREEQFNLLYLKDKKVFIY